MGYPTGEPTAAHVPIYLSVGAGTRHEVGHIHLTPRADTPPDGATVSVTFEPPTRSQLADLLEAVASAIRTTEATDHD